MLLVSRSASKVSSGRFVHEQLIREVISAAQDVSDAAKRMKSHIHDSHNLSNEAQRIATCIQTSSFRAYHASRPLVISIPARCALVIAREHQCAAIMKKACERAMLKQLRKHKETSAAIRSWIRACDALSEVLMAQAKGNDCGLLEDPHTAGPTLPNQDRRDELMFDVSRLTPAYEGFKAVILGMANMTDGLPFPLKAVPQTVLQIIRHVESGQAAAARITELLLEVQSQWNLVAEWNGPGVSSDKIRSHIEAFFGHLFHIFIRLRILQYTHPIKGTIAAENFNSVLREESQKIAGSTAKLKLALMLSNSNAIERVEEQMTTLAMAANGVTNQAKGTSTIDLTISQLPPPPPHVFHGREDVIISMVDMILLYMLKLLAANIAILGAGGIGKTSLALAILQNERIVAKFPHRRYFLSCEAFQNVTSLITALAKLFSVGETNDVLQDIAHMASQSSSILVLDNFETVWLMQDDQVRTQAELVLRHLGAIKTLTWSSRVAVSSFPGAASLEPFSPSAAAQTFDEIAGDMHRDVETERSAVEELVRAVDCMPLAITLLAELAQRGNKPSELLSHWRESHTAMLQTSATGLLPPVFGHFKSFFQDLVLARRRLLDHALISVGPAGELRMLSPIRHYILSTYSMTPQNFSAMRYIYLELAFSAPREPCEEFATESAAIVPEYENLTGFLLHLIRAEDPSQDLFDAVAAVSEYSYWTIPSTTLREAFQSRLHDHPIWLAECSTDLGRMYLAKSQYDAALDILEQAIHQWDTTGDTRMAAYCTYLIGTCQQQQGSYDAAVNKLSRAQCTFIDLGDVHNSARCLHRLGSIALDQRQHDVAKEYITAARSTFTKFGDLIGVSQCTSLLSTNYAMTGNFSALEAEIYAGLAESAAIANQTGIGKSMSQNVKDVHGQQQDLFETEDLLLLTREVSGRLGLPCNPETEAQEMQEAFNAAIPVFERLGFAADVQWCQREIEKLIGAVM
ncbi:hypothetical protein BKA62DRAFT_809932 [Auriculariales sp. MPI-PUGE-AT-0066]|nr:hypothetical protein BKA62DRAFT_809932 [Auriculariales sp. MPI-PUGE-AT-0066]